MPIEPKHAPSDGRPVTQRQFTDREDFIKTFRGISETLCQVGF
jgi:hypothetical protein